jgi:myosin-crossreactive antigen
VVATEFDLRILMDALYELNDGKNLNTVSLSVSAKLPIKAMLRAFSGTTSGLSPMDLVHKPITECSGNEICQEWLYHMGVPINQIEDLAKTQCSFCFCKITNKGYVASIFRHDKWSVPNGSRHKIRYQSICHISVLILCLDPLGTDHLSCLKMLAT